MTIVGTQVRHGERRYEVRRINGIIGYGGDDTFELINEGAGAVMTQETKFKVGDTVKAVTDEYGYTTKSNGWEGVVTIVNDSSFAAKTTKGRAEDIDFEFIGLRVDDFELVGAKMKKKERIEKLEERVDALYTIIESLRKALD